MYHILSSTVTRPVFQMSQSIFGSVRKRLPYPLPHRYEPLLGLRSLRVHLFNFHCHPTASPHSTKSKSLHIPKQYACYSLQSAFYVDHSSHPTTPPILSRAWLSAPTSEGRRESWVGQYVCIRGHPRVSAPRVEANKTALRVSDVIPGSLVRKHAQRGGTAHRVRKQGRELRVSDSEVLCPLVVIQFGSVRTHWHFLCLPWSGRSLPHRTLVLARDQVQLIKTTWPPTSKLCTACSVTTEEGELSPPRRKWELSLAREPERRENVPGRRTGVCEVLRQESRHTESNRSSSVVGAAEQWWKVGLGR